MSKPNPFDDLDQMSGSETASTSPGGTAVDEGSVNHFELARTFPHIDDAYMQHVGESEPEAEQEKTADLGYGAHGIMVGGKAWRPNMSDVERADYFKPKSVTEVEQMSTLEEYRALNKLLPNVSPYVARATNVNTRAALVQAGRASTAADRDQAILSAASGAQSDMDIQVVLAAMDNFPTESPSEMRTKYLADPRMSEQARKALEEYMVPKVRREKIGMLVNAGLLPSDYEARLNRARGARDAFRRGTGRDDPTLAYEFETLFNRPEAVARNFTDWEKRKREINAELDAEEETRSKTRSARRAKRDAALQRQLLV
jgi:hypothetical protein